MLACVHLSNDKRIKSIIILYLQIWNTVIRSSLCLPNHWRLKFVLIYILKPQKYLLRRNFSKLLFRTELWNFVTGPKRQEISKIGPKTILSFLFIELMGSKKYMKPDPPKPYWAPVSILVRSLDVWLRSLAISSVTPVTFSLWTRIPSSFIHERSTYVLDSLTSCLRYIDACMSFFCCCLFLLFVYLFFLNVLKHVFIHFLPCVLSLLSSIFIQFTLEQNKARSTSTLYE